MSPRRRTERATEETTEGDTDGIAGEYAAQLSADADQELADLGVQLPDGAMGTLFRLVDGGEKVFITEEPVAGFSLASVAARYGGGRYMVFLKKPHPENASRWLKAGSKTFGIEGPPRYNVPDAVATPASASSLESEKLARSYGELMQETMKRSLEQQQLMQQMQLAVVARLSERPADTSMDLLKTLLPILLANKVPNGPTIADVIALADRMANKTSPTSQLKETMELITTARELAGGAQDGPSWLPVAERALGLFGRAVDYAPKQLPAPAPEHSNAPAPAAPAVEVSTVPPIEHPLLQWLAPQVPALVQHAQADHDPDTYAGVICDLITAEHWPQVLAFLQAPDFLQQLQAAFPVMAPVQDWFSELRDILIERLQDLITPPAEPAHPEGEEHGEETRNA